MQTVTECGWQCKEQLKLTPTNTNTTIAANSHSDASHELTPVQGAAA
jgi:hypothetical protein